MKKTIMILIALLMLAGCGKSGNPTDSAEVKQLKETIAQRDQAIESLITDKETLQAILDQFDPDVLQQNSMVYTAIPLLMTSEAKCSGISANTHCSLASMDGELIVPIKEWPSFMYVLNPNPNQIFIVYYDEKELWVYADYSIVSKGEADAIIAYQGSASIIKTFDDGRVLMTFATPGLQLTNPAAIAAFNAQFKDKLEGTIDVQLNLTPGNS